MKIKDEFLATIEKRLGNEDEWSKSPMGELAQFIVDNPNYISVRDIATIMGYHPVVVTRWFKEIKTPGRGFTEIRKIKLRLIRLLLELETLVESGELEPDAKDVVERITTNMG